jgi:DUF1009 family protein
VNWGQIGRIVGSLKSHGGDGLVIAGGVTRPDLWAIRPDAGFFISLPQILGLMVGGDDSVLTRVVRFFEGKGLHVLGAHEVAPDLLAGAGPIGTLPLDEEARADARLGFSVRRSLGPLDAGQAVVVECGKVLAIEGAEGTDAMLQRVAGLREGQSGARRGVLAKGPKPGQELRVDMPAIGPRTIGGAVAARLAGIALEAGSVLVLDRQAVVVAADDAGCAVEGLADSDAVVPAANNGSAALPAGHVMGRLSPSRRDAADIAKGLAATAWLAPYATGSSLVVSRAHILAIDAAEGPLAMLGRVRALRQWGARRSRRRIGVLVRRVEGRGDDADFVRRLMTEASAQGLAGVAAIGAPKDIAAYEDAARLAGEAELFLVTVPQSETVPQLQTLQ